MRRSPYPRLEVAGPSIGPGAVAGRLTLASPPEADTSGADEHPPESRYCSNGAVAVIRAQRLRRTLAVILDQAGVTEAAQRR